MTKHPTRFDYALAIAVMPFLGIVFTLLWLTTGRKYDNGNLILANDKQIKIGGWKWFWYRLLLSHPTAERCEDCHKIIDSIHTTNLCQCAFELDMKGIK